MILPFDPQGHVIIVPTRVSSPDAEFILRFLLDTGATTSMLNWHTAVKLGYEPNAISARMQVATASGVESVSRITVEKLFALGLERRNFPVLCHPLPPSADIDGVLGLDFFRGQRLTLDFRVGLVMLD